jgi:hypothetical protein
MTITNQGACQSQKTAKSVVTSELLANFPNQELVANPNRGLGTFASRGASNGQAVDEEVE